MVGGQAAEGLECRVEQQEPLKVSVKEAPCDKRSFLLGLPPPWAELDP